MAAVYIHTYSSMYLKRAVPVHWFLRTAATAEAEAGSSNTAVLIVVTAAQVWLVLCKTIVSYHRTRYIRMFIHDVYEIAYDEGSAWMPDAGDFR